MLGLILLKTLLKVVVISAKSSAVKKTAINGVIIASGLTEVNRNQRYNKPREDFKNKENDEIKMIE